MWSSCEKPAKPSRYAYAGHNPPPPVVFLGNASIEVAGEEHKRPRLKKRRWAALSPSNRISDRVTGARNVPAGQRDVAR